MNLSVSLLLIVPLFILFLFLFFVRFLTRQKQKYSSERKSDVSFVVDTFHDLVRQLKEKEQQLQELKKAAERRAEEIESYSDNILQSVPSGVVSFDNQLRITKVNISACRILCMSETEMVGRSYREVFNSPLREIIASDEDIRRLECKYKNIRSEEVWLGLSKTGLFNKKGERIGCVLIFTDITEVKALEARVRLKEHLSSLGEISLGIAHELRNPMAVISGYAKMLMKEAALASRPEIRAIYKELEIMNRIISDFMSFARPVSPSFQPVDLEELIRETVDSLLKECNNIRVRYNLLATTLVTDEVLLRQSICNILQNAIDAMPDGGVITISTMEDSGSIIIEISDTGYGIDDEIKEKIFQPFFSKKEKGTGLGLAIVQKNIAILDGKVELKSSTEKGTVFRILLPQSRTEP